MVGLIGRKSYPRDTALVFERCASVHTWFMQMSIDIVFVDEGWRVLSVHGNVAPGNVLREPDAFAVLELAAGEAARMELAPGAVIYERSARQICAKLGERP
jgi:uncharacterized membrane protein (UPF0127 family)